mmetsp:Transcript_3078/g.7996  ORF Transcript_3078/g.7996 Transcript_3078/m.7996 type:complete len:562 (+) Transcript_3078:1-1686(+)
MHCTSVLLDDRGNLLMFLSSNNHRKVQEAAGGHRLAFWRLFVLALPRILLNATEPAGPVSSMDYGRYLGMNGSASTYAREIAVTRVELPVEFFPEPKIADLFYSSRRRIYVYAAGYSLPNFYVASKLDGNWTKIEICSQSDYRHWYPWRVEKGENIDYWNGNFIFGAIDTCPHIFESNVDESAIFYTARACKPYSPFTANAYGKRALGTFRIEGLPDSPEAIHAKTCIRLPKESVFSLDHCIDDVTARLSKLGLVQCASELQRTGFNSEKLKHCLFEMKNASKATACGNSIRCLSHGRDNEIDGECADKIATFFDESFACTGETYAGKVSRVAGDELGPEGTVFAAVPPNRLTWPPYIMALSTFEARGDRVYLLPSYDGMFFDYRFYQAEVSSVAVMAEHLTSSSIMTVGAEKESSLLFFQSSRGIVMHIWASKGPEQSPNFFGFRLSNLPALPAGTAAQKGFLESVPFRLSRGDVTVEVARADGDKEGKFSLQILRVAPESKEPLDAECKMTVTVTWVDLKEAVFHLDENSMCRHLLGKSSSVVARLFGTNVICSSFAVT